MRSKPTSKVQRSDRVRERRSGAPRGPSLSPEDVEWDALSEESLATLREIALPHSLGLSFEEIADRLGVGTHALTKRMRALREELLAQFERSSS
jgi:DNA-directed RNA polymerase specialized sigma24 family protein